MTADTLRKAATLMRKRANGAARYSPSPWEAHVATPGDPANGPTEVRVSTSKRMAVASFGFDEVGGSDAEHIASWHPAVAFAVADWLDLHAAACTDGYGKSLDDLIHPAAIAVARAYLGEES